ncbi:phosphate acyltransferase PlsX [Alicyclobacillus kakegawensis]|uniref:phosphate acyltransferase PlsX n=1 Tax=Alicyclobacillus kakegawensis TaxID=392012 RepID=UPI000833F793|nr:phosphate acyltransferase PlsX [Alicyclobacillus kakegawensis]
MKLAVDVMGGDLGASAPLAAVGELARSHPDVEFCLVGTEAAVTQAKNFTLPANVQMVPSQSVIQPDEEPVRAVRRKPDSSLVMAARMVREGEADAMVSAGNTGALVAAGLLTIGRLAGIERPALAPVLPTFQGHGVLLLDAGATMDASPFNLVQYAHMGAAYSQHVLGVAKPRIGLLNVGTEALKGNNLTKAAYEQLEACGLNFIGNVEARNLLEGACDVVVCDGFVGNVVLKLTEGIGLGLFQALKTEIAQAGVRAKLGATLLAPKLRAFAAEFDYAEYGGAPFLGVAGGCIKAHGSSNQRAWYTALMQAIRFCRQEVNSKLISSLQKQDLHHA